MNKLILFIAAVVFLSVNVFGQITIDVAENTLKIAGLEEETFYYGFSEGDQLVFNFEELNGKELKELEILELPSNSKFMDYKTKKIENKILNITKTGVYKFRFSNSALAGRICKFKIQRITADKNKNFNSSVYWKAVYDTTYTSTEEKYLVKSDTSFQNFYSASPQISSTNALNGNLNYQVLTFDLPDNTASWSFYIGTGKEGREEFETARDKFTQDAASLISKIPEFGPMAALALTGVSYFNKVQGEDNVKYYFLADANSAALFPNSQFLQYKMGDVINEASQMKSPLSGRIYLALYNDNTMDPIVVTIKATAVVINKQWGMKTNIKANVFSRQEAYLKN